MSSTIRPGDYNPQKPWAQQSRGKKISSNTSQIQTPQRVGFDFVVGKETTEEEYRKRVRLYFEGKFYGEKTTAPAFKTVGEKVLSIENHIKNIEPHKQNELEKFKKLDAELKHINSQINDAENKQSKLENLRQISSITNSPNSGLTERADMSFELNTVAVKMDGLKNIRDSTSAARNESNRKISVYNAGINECTIIRSELLIYGDAAPKERR